MDAPIHSLPRRRRLGLLEVRRDVSPRAARVLFVLSFVLPLFAWSVVSYVPFVWHPSMRVENPGSVSYFQPGMLVDREVFDTENQSARAEGRALATGLRANPIYLPAPHEV